MTAEVVVLGAGYAGMMAAIRLAWRAGARARVTLVNESPYFVERIRLHQLAAGHTPRRRPLSSLLRKTQVRLRVGRVAAIEPRARQIQVEAAGTLGFDFLVYALGSGRRDASIEGLAEHAYDVAAEDSANALRQRLIALPKGARVSVIGAGLTGLELAAEIAEARPGLRVTLLASSELGDGLSPAGKVAVQTALAELGVEVRSQARVAAVGRSALELTHGEALASDVSVWCGGLSASPLARQMGLPVAPSGQLALDDLLRVPSVPQIFGAGDGVGITGVSAPGLRMACATAMPLGAHAADNVLRAIAGEPLEPFRFAYWMRCISLGRKRGLIQRVSGTDEPLEKVVSGRLGAKLKESVCRFTLTALAIERVFPGTYSWPGKGSTAAAAEATIA